jgi:magnesium chelatase subunit I
MTTKPLFPFSALIGQDNLQRALLLAAIDPGIGGVLIEGPRGTAKSTSARALSELLPTGQFVTLPLGAAEEQLIGTLDIEGALQKGEVKFAPGLLAKAHGGVLYIDEVNLLPDALVDQLLDVATSQVNIVERDGISHTHPASFVLIGTMNREEGELRPQLLDRFGLALALDNYRDAALRQQIVKARIAFDSDPLSFRQRFTEQQQTVSAAIQRARANLSRLEFSDAIYAHASELCLDAHVDGVRADLVMLRAARALATLQDDDEMTIAHLDAVAELALRHRRQTPPRTTPQSLPRTAQNTRDDISFDIDNAASQNAHDRNANTSSADSADTWGEMPPQAIAAMAVKGVKPLPLKKR